MELIADASLHNAGGESNDVWVPLHAWQILGQLRDARAVEPLIGLFDPLRGNDWAGVELPIGEEEDWQK